VNEARILIVDDDVALLEALPQALRLRMDGIEIDTAESAADALEAIRTTDYDAIVMMGLVMIMAKTPDPAFYNKYIPQVVADSAGAIEVHSYKEGRDALQAGKTIRYVGAGGPIVLDQYHNASGAFEIVGYAANGQTRQLDTVSAADIAKLHA